MPGKKPGNNHEVDCPFNIECPDIPPKYPKFSLSGVELGSVRQ
jgi:hypothetical protein